MDLSRGWVITLSTIGIGLFLMLITWILVLNHTSINEIGIQYNAMNGEIIVQEEPGWYVTGVFTQVAYISTLPFKVEIPSSAKVIVSKMVVFDQKGLKEYVRMQGFGYNINSSLHSAFLGYAFSGHDYPFIRVIQETTQEDTEGLRKVNINE